MYDNLYVYVRAKVCVCVCVSGWVGVCVYDGIQ